MVPEIQMDRQQPMFFEGRGGGKVLNDMPTEVGKKIDRGGATKEEADKRGTEAYELAQAHERI